MIDFSAALGSSLSLPNKSLIPFSFTHRKERDQPQLLAFSRLKEAAQEICPGQESPNGALVLESHVCSLQALSSEISATWCAGLRLGGEQEKSQKTLWLEVTECQVSSLGNLAPLRQARGLGPWMYLPLSNGF